MEQYLQGFARGYSPDFFRNQVRTSQKEECPAPTVGRLALAEVPMQEFEDIYTGECGFGRGTIFAALYFPLGNLNRGGGNFEGTR